MGAPSPGNRGKARWLALAATMGALWTASPVRAADGLLPPGYTCGSIVALHDRWSWLYTARQMRGYLARHGFSPVQITAAERCVRAKK